MICTKIPIIFITEIHKITKFIRQHKRSPIVKDILRNISSGRDIIVPGPKLYSIAQQQKQHWQITHRKME